MRNLILIACAALAACTPTASDEGVNVTNSNVTVATNPAPVNDCGLTKGTLKDEQALFTAETAYNIPAHAYVQADGTGKLPADLKAKVKPMLVTLYSYLGLARKAYQAGDGCSLKNYSDLADALSKQVQAALPK